jgi:hypothetical protein
VKRSTWLGVGLWSSVVVAKDVKMRDSKRLSFLRRLTAIWLLPRSVLLRFALEVSSSNMPGPKSNVVNCEPTVRAEIQEFLGRKCEAPFDHPSNTIEQTQFVLCIHPLARVIQFQKLSS